VFAEKVRTGHVHSQGVVPDLSIEVVDRTVLARESYPSVIVENIKASEAVDRRRDGRLDLGFAAYVRCDGRDVASAAGKHGLKVGEARLVDIGKPESRTFVSQSVGD
jgi:hypothetical protein